jgi:hypothetical protein
VEARPGRLHTYRKSGIVRRCVAGRRAKLKVTCLDVGGPLASGGRPQSVGHTRRSRSGSIFGPGFDSRRLHGDTSSTGLPVELVSFQRHAREATDGVARSSTHVTRRTAVSGRGQHCRATSRFANWIGPGGSKRPVRSRHSRSNSLAPSPPSGRPMWRQRQLRCGWRSTKLPLPGQHFGVSLTGRQEATLPFTRP